MLRNVHFRDGVGNFQKITENTYVEKVNHIFLGKFENVFSLLFRLIA